MGSVLTAVPQALILFLQGVYSQYVLQAHDGVVMWAPLRQLTCMIFPGG